MENVFNVLWFFAGLWCARIMLAPRHHYIPVHFDWSDFVLSQARKAIFEARMSGANSQSQRFVKLTVDKAVINVTMVCDGEQFTGKSVEQVRITSHGSE